jgi:diguanylate cyclase (GGDEF)-like protein
MWDEMSLAISLLGSFRVRLDGQEVSTGFRTKKERALLAYLAVEANRLHPREVLGELLWPDRPEGYARTNLRQALLGLRRAIGGAGMPFLDITDEIVQFKNGPEMRLDFEEFTRLVQGSLAHPHHSLDSCPVCAGNFEKAVALYRGDFLEDLQIPAAQSYQEWSFYYREQYFRYLLTALQNLSQYHQVQRDFDTAHQYAWRYVNLAPLEEDAHRQLMNLLVISGRRSAALEQYQTCCRILRQELGVDPSAETQELYEQIRTGMALRLEPQVINLQLTNLPAQLNSFIGRQQEIADLEHCLTNTAHRLITVVGMSGVGKSRLVLYAVRRCSEDFPDGIWHVPLEAVYTGDGLTTAIYEAIGLPIEEGDGAQDQLLKVLGSLRILLVLDHFDHLVSETGYLVEILEQAPAVKIVVTTRQRLPYQAACLFHLYGLPCSADDGLEEALEYPAVQLFLDRSRHSRVGFRLSEENLPNVLAICQMMEGLPLAIELAAGALRDYTCKQLEVELSCGLDILRTSVLDLPERHRSIQEAFNSSLELLNEEQLTAFYKVSVLADEFTFQEAQSKDEVSLACLSALVDRSLLYAVAPQRYRMHPLLKQYTRGQMACSGENRGEGEVAAKEHQVMLDTAIGLTDQNMFNDRLIHMLARSARDHHLAAVLMLGFDGYNAFIKTYPQEASDELIGMFGEGLRNTLRKSDTMAYLGQGRFGVILEDITHPRDGAIVARKILHALSKDGRFAGYSITLTPRIGISQYPADGDDAQAMLAIARKALAYARREGKSYLDGSTIEG